MAVKIPPLQARRIVVLDIFELWVTYIFKEKI